MSLGLAHTQSALENNLVIKKKLALAYQILGFLGLDDHTYTHLSARSADQSSYYIYPFGLRFEEVTSDNLLRVSLDGQVLEGAEYQYNRTGYTIHGSIYRVRPEIQAIFHVHTPSTVAVSSLEQGLMPLSQWALHFYKKVSYHAYDSLALDTKQGRGLVTDLGDKNVMLMRNHGALTCGKTMHEALFYIYHLEKACQAQCLTLSMNQPLVIPSHETCEKAVHDLLSFEQDLGARDWEAWKRLIERRSK